MKHIYLKRIMPIILVAALLLSCVPVMADESSSDTFVFPERTPVHFSKMTSDNFDADVLDAALDDIIVRLTEADALDALKADYDIITDQYDRLTTDCEILYLHYCMDVSNEEAFAAYSSKNELTVVYSDRICITMSQALESDYAEALITYINSEDVVNDYLGYEAMTEEEFELNNNTIVLEDRYYAIEESEDAANEAAALYLEVLDNMIAYTNCKDICDNYADYIYDVSYFRDYTPGDTAVLHAWVKDFVVPLLDEMVYVVFGENYDDYIEYCSLQLTEGEIIDRVEPYLRSVSSKADETFTLMTELGLYDLAYSDNKYPGGFTTSLDYYGVPFIFDSPYGYAADIETMIHEFGHYLQMYNNAQPMTYRYDCLDVSEIDSQAMEMLMLTYADEIYGEDLGNISRFINLYNMLKAIVNGCAFDEFQQAALAARIDGSLNTPEDVNALFLDIESEYYGEYYEYYCWGSDWYCVPHTFNSPFYYISYATSATAALSFLVIADEDYDLALELYSQLIEMGCDKGFSNTLKTLGLANPLTEEGCEVLTNGLMYYFGNLLYSDEEAA